MARYNKKPESAEQMIEESIVNNETDDSIVNVLKPVKVTIRFIKRKRGYIEDERSEFFGGIGINSKVVLTVPNKKNSSTLMDPLTKQEKDFFEDALGLEKNALSVYHKPCYWSSSAHGTINKVVLGKQDLILDLSTLDGYLQYAILRCNKDRVAPSLEALENEPKATYMFYMTNDLDETKSAGKKANVKFNSYMKYGDYKDNYDVLRYIIFVLEGRKISNTTKIEMLQAKVSQIIDNDPVTFNKFIEDKFIETKALIMTCVEKGFISNRNNFYFLKENGEQLAIQGEEPRLNNAAKFLNMPENQDIRENLMKKCWK